MNKDAMHSLHVESVSEGSILSIYYVYWWVNLTWLSPHTPAQKGWEHGYQTSGGEAYQDRAATERTDSGSTRRTGGVENGYSYPPGEDAWSRAV